jgi:hypothetical protein
MQETEREKFNKTEFLEKVREEWSKEKEVNNSLVEKKEVVNYPKPQTETKEEKKSIEVDDFYPIKLEVKAMLKIAEEKGINYAMKKIKDPLVLDLFHDLLAKDENIKKFFKK